MESNEIEMELESNTGSDYEEEEYLVYVEIEPTSLSENQIRNADNLKIHGLETKKPLLQINNLYFEGESDISMGTHLFFEKDETIPVDDLYCKCESYYKFRAQTNKMLKMSRVLIKDKASESKAVQKKDLKAVKEQLKITKSYGDALKMFLEPGRKPPRKIPQDESFCEIVQTSSAVKLESQDSSSSGIINLSSL